MSREEKRLSQMVDQLQRENAMLRDRAGNESHSRFTMQEAPGKAENLLQQALDTAGLAVWEWDLAGKVVHTSSSFSSLLGDTTQGSATAKSWHAEQLWAKVHPDHIAPLQNAIVRVLKLQDTRLQIEFCLTHLSQQIWVECTGAVAQLDMLGRCETMMGICRDITSSKVAPTHLNTPADLSVPPLAQAVLNEPPAALDEPFTANLPAQLTPFALRPWLQGAIEPMRLAAHHKGLEFDLQIDEALPHSLVADTECLQEVLTHLIDNAIQFTPQGSVQVVLQLAGNTPQGVDLLLEVIDTGIGIDDAQQQVIFDVLAPPVASNAPSPAQTGQGLPTCAKLIAAMGGSLQLASALGEGSRFMALIPLGAAQQDAVSFEMDAADTVPAPVPDSASVAPSPAVFDLPEPYEAPSSRQSAVTEAMPLSTDIGPPPPVDRERMLNKLGGSSAALHEAANHFKQDLRDFLSAIFKALKLSDWESLELNAHALKGSLLGITANEAAQYAHDLELAAKDQDTRGAQHAFDQLSEHAKPVYEAVGQW